MKKHIIKHQSIGNERGGMVALLSVLVFSMIIVTTMTSFYIYIENRAKFQAKIKENYQFGYVMEDMSRAIIEARERFLRGECPGSSGFVDCTEVCLGATGGVCVNTGALYRAQTGSDSVCTPTTAGGSAPAYCAAMASNKNQSILEPTMVASHEIKEPRMVNWLNRLDNFFDTTIVKNAPSAVGKMHAAMALEIKPPTVFGWLLPETAVAGTIGGPPPPLREDPPGDQGCADAFCNAIASKAYLPVIGGSQGCSAHSSDPRCKKCGSAERTSGRCVRFTVCPPWASGEEGGCRGSEVHQTVMLSTDVGTPPPPVAPVGALCWGNVTSIDAGTHTREGPPGWIDDAGTREGPPGWIDTEQPRCALSGECTSQGQVRQTLCNEVNNAGTVLSSRARYRISCGEFAANPGYQGCSIPNVASPTCSTTTSTRICAGAEADYQPDPSCCGPSVTEIGRSICGPTVGVNATCEGPGGPGPGPFTPACADYCAFLATKGPGCTVEVLASGCSKYCSGDGMLYYNCP